MDGSQPEVRWLQTSEPNPGPEGPLALFVDKARSLSGPGGTQGPLGSPVAASLVPCQPTSRCILREGSVFMEGRLCPRKWFSYPKRRLADSQPEAITAQTALVNDFI